MIKGATHVHLGPILVSFRTFRHSLFLKPVSCLGLFLQLLTARRLQDRCGILRIRLLEIHNTLNIKIELINEKNRKSTKHQKSNKCGTISRCNDSNFLHSLQYMYSTIYTYMAHLLSSKTEKIGKNSDLNELHCRTFIASKT